MKNARRAIVSAIAPAHNLLRMNSTDTDTSRYESSRITYYCDNTFRIYLFVCGAFVSVLFLTHGEQGVFHVVPQQRHR